MWITSSEIIQYAHRSYRMTALTRSNLTRDAPLFIRDVLDTNVTDPESRSATWIYKNTPQLEFENADLPYVFIHTGDIAYDTKNLVGDRRRNMRLVFEIEVWTNKMQYKDEIADDIQDTLYTTTSADGDGDTIASNLLRLKSMRTVDADIYTDYPNITYIKRITAEFAYHGS